MGKAMKNTKRGRQPWISKFMSGWCATGKMMKIACPRYNAAVEDNTHILLCQAAGVVNT